MLSKDLKVKTESAVWLDVLNKSICRHKSSNYRFLSVLDLINVLKNFQGKLSVLMYCLRDRTPNINNSPKELEKSNSIQVFSIVKDFISVRKGNNPKLLNQLKALYQSLEI